MHLEQYEYAVSDSLLDYEFYSVGPKGKIKKIISFSPRNINGMTYFNLGFGDDSKENGRIDDLAISDNKDTEKVLATIAAAVLDFTNHFPDTWIYAEGSTAARTRLYQMGISKYWQYIEPLLFVYGLRNEYWEPFMKNISYNAFLVIRKRMYFYKVNC